MDEKWPTHGAYTCIKQPTATELTQHTRGRGRGEPVKTKLTKNVAGEEYGGGGGNLDELHC